MIPVVWLAEADAELKEAMERYEGIRPELGQCFAAAVLDTVEEIANTPLRFAVVEKGGGEPECAVSLMGYSSWWKKPG